MFGERNEAHGSNNTKTVWRARQSCRMTATCMTAASFPDSVALAVDDVHEDKMGCWSSCNAWGWHKPCTCNLLVCCLPEHDLVVFSQDVIKKISVCLWKSFDTYSFPSSPFDVERIHGRSHDCACSNTIE